MKLPQRSDPFSCIPCVLFLTITSVPSFCAPDPARSQRPVDRRDRPYPIPANIARTFSKCLAPPDPCFPPQQTGEGMPNSFFPLPCRLVEISGNDPSTRRYIRTLGVGIPAINRFNQILELSHLMLHPHHILCTTQSNESPKPSSGTAM